MTSPDWHAPAASGRLDATVTLPGSKSLTNRYLVLAALASDTSRLRRPLRSRDTELMAQALRDNASAHGLTALAAPLRLRLLTGRDKASERRVTLAALALWLPMLGAR